MAIFIPCNKCGRLIEEGKEQMFIVGEKITEDNRKYFIQICMDCFNKEKNRKR